MTTNDVDPVTAPEPAPSGRPPGAPTLALDTPQRQSPVAVLADLFDVSTLRQLAETFVPIGVIAVTTGGRAVLVGLPLVVIVVALGALVRWWRTVFWVERGEFVFAKGLVNRTRLQIPIDRIQQIATEQGPVQRIFGVRRVLLDTAGSAGAEVMLTAVDERVVAELRMLVVGSPRATAEDPAGDAPPDPAPPSGADAYGAPILRLRLPDLIRLGLIRPGGQALSGLVGVLGLGLGGAASSVIEDRVTSAFAFALFVVAVVVVVVVASVLGAVLRDHALTVWRTADGLRLTAGLLNRREQFARIDRVQLVSRRANPVERFLERTSIALPQASLLAEVIGSSSQRFSISGIPDSAVDGLVARFLPAPVPPTDRAIASVAVVRWTQWGALVPAIVFLGLAGAVAWFDGSATLAIALVVAASGVAVVGPLVARAHHRRWRWGTDDSILTARHGLFVEQQAAVAIRKVQSVVVSQNWWQRRRGVATILFATAGGAITIPHLPVTVAESLRDRILEQVSADEGPWM